MNFNTIRFISGRLSSSSKKHRFLNFARMIALISVTLGTMALIISLSVLEGFDKSLHENAVKFTSHISVTTINRKPSLDYKEKIEKLKNEIPEIKSAVPVIERECLVKSKTFVDGIVIRGINRNYDITDLHSNVIQGSFDLKDDNEKKIVIGKRLSQKLKVKLYDSLVIYSIKNFEYGKNPFPTIDKFRIVGIYETGMAQYDDSYAFISYRASQRLFGMSFQSASGYEVLLYNILDAPRIGGVIEDVLKFPHISYTVFELHSPIFLWIELQKAPIPLVLGLISIVAVLNIITILLITVVEKTHTIGILRALGMKNSNIISIFIIQGTTIGILGSILGSGIALLFAYLQQTFKLIHLDGNIYFLDALPVEIVAWHYILVFALTLILSFLATLIPAAIALKVSPIKAIRFK